MTPEQAAAMKRVRPTPIGEPIKRLFHHGNRKPYFRSYSKYICQCGAEFEALMTEVRSGKRSHCGCVVKVNHFNRRHGMSKTRIYKTWAGMITRCLDETYKSYARYGGRGIRVCERWRTFENFLEDMGLHPSKEHSLDRIDVNGNYEPGNCRWATVLEQNRNRHNSLSMTAFGKTMLVVEWAELTGIRYKKIHARLMRGDTPEAALRKTRLQSAI